MAVWYCFCSTTQMPYSKSWTSIDTIDKYAQTYTWLLYLWRSFISKYYSRCVYQDTSTCRMQPVQPTVVLYFPFINFTSFYSLYCDVLLDGDCKGQDVARELEVSSRLYHYYAMSCMFTVQCKHGKYSVSLYNAKVREPWVIWRTTRKQLSSIHILQHCECFWTRITCACPYPCFGIYSWLCYYDVKWPIDHYTSSQ